MEFLIRKPLISGTQKAIDRLNPKVNIHVPADLPLPSVQQLKAMAAIVAKINGLEQSISQLSDAQLQEKTGEFKKRYETVIAGIRKAYHDVREENHRAVKQEEKEALTLKEEKAKEDLKAARKKILDELLPEAFAVVRETGKRTLSMRHFDVQLIGGIVLHNGNIAEMTTGEGKTLVATLPAYLNALTGEGVHVVTVNDYLARRDREWMGPIYEFLGLSIGVIQHDIMPSARQQAYACDITYGTNNEFGFDYLRDNMVNFKEEMVQRGHHFAIVDEVDSILIDEARTPLIISGPAEESTDKYYKAYEISKKLTGRRITEKDEVNAKYSEEGLAGLSKGLDYLADEKAKSISLTEDGEQKAATMFGIPNLHDMESIEYRHHILQALRAKEFFHIDVDYVIRDGGVMIVDEFTGRLMPGRRWSDGLHQAVEAKERLKIERENQTLASITFQNYFRLYDKLSGMTGTAYTEATEFKQIYNLDCIAVPTNKKLQRVNHSDCIYRSVKEKFNAVVEEIAILNKEGRPVLVGTISIEKSETLSRLLTQRGVKHQVLNAKYHEQEANIIAQAGRLAGVTIATNMAGRGTDIVLGGNAEYLAKNLAAQKLTDKHSQEEREELTKKFIEQFKQQCREEHDKVVGLGGLHVLGTERHESRRIDNQLRGRQGRQGDPGSSRFYVSLEDDLMRLFASERIIGIMDKLGFEEGQVLEHPWLSGALENAQKRVEAHNFEIRKHLLEYDNVMNRQREVIYRMRRSILESENVKHLIIQSVDDTVFDQIQQYLNTLKEDGSWDWEGLSVYLKTQFNYTLAVSREDMRNMSTEDIEEKIIKEVVALYDLKEKDISAPQLRYIERMLILHTIDSKWKDHLYGMDQLKEGIGLRSYGQRDPLIEYKREGFGMFQAMYASIHQEVAEMIFKLQPVRRATGGGDQTHEVESLRKTKGVFGALPQKLVHEEISGMSAIARHASEASPSSSGEGAPHSQHYPGGSVGNSPKPAPVQHSGPKVGRNDPCPCGSGKKYKKCCGQ